VTRVGSLKARSLDVHFVPATNRDLKRRRKAGRFRYDLYRLSGIALKRRDEILPSPKPFLRRRARRTA